MARLGSVAPPSPADPPSVAPVARREAALLGLACLAVAAGLLWLSRYGIDPLDEGYFAHLSQRMAAGEAIYRDFPVPYTPGAFALHAWLFQLFGVNLWVLRPLLIGVRVGLVALLYLLGRRAMPPLWAAIAPAALLLQDPAPATWNAHPAWYALFFYVAGVWAGLRALDRRRLGWWLAAGLFGGAAFLFTQNIGLFLPMALAWLVLFDPVPTSASGVRNARGTAARVAFLGLLLGAFVYTTLPFFSGAVALTILGPLAATAAAFLVACTFRAPEPDWAVLLRRGLLVAAGFALVVAPALVWLGLAVGFESIPFAAYVGSLDQKGFYLPLGAEPGFVLLLALPLAGGAAAILLARRPGLVGRSRTGPLPALLVPGVVLWFNQYPHMDVPHALWSGALLWIVGAFLLWQIVLYARHVSRQWAGAFAAALLLWPSALLYPLLLIRANGFLEWRPAPPFVVARAAKVGLPAASVEAQPGLAYDLRRLARRVRDSTAEGEAIFVYPAAPVVYLLADRPNATPYAHIFPGLVSPADERRLIAALERQPTQLLVRDRIGVQEFLPPTELVDLQAYVERHYTLLEQAGRFDLLLRRAD